MTLPKVNIIILNWNGKTDTIECLESLKKMKYPNYKITLVDNGSADGSVECFKRLYPEIELIENQKNLGFAEGNNVAIKEVIERGNKYVLLLNNDTVVDKNFLCELVKIAEGNQSIGILGPTVYYYSQPNRIQSAGAKILWNKGTDYIFRLNEFDNGRHIETIEVDYVSGCAILIRTEVFKKVGYLNKDYFAYWEETDLCVRAHKVSYRIVYVPRAKIWHKGGSTSKKITGFSQYHLIRNMFWFMKQHASKYQYLSFSIFFFGFRLWKIIAVEIVMYKSINNLKYLFKGIIDGIKV